MKPISPLNPHGPSGTLPPPRELRSTVVVGGYVGFIRRTSRGLGVLPVSPTEVLGGFGGFAGFAGRGFGGFRGFCRFCRHRFWVVSGVSPVLPTVGFWLPLHGPPPGLLVSVE